MMMDGEEQTSLLADDRDDEAVREDIRKFRTDCRSRVQDTWRRCAKRARRVKASVMSYPLVVRLVLFTGRAAFLYDYFSDALVAREFYQTRNPKWCGVTLFFMTTPYLGIMFSLWNAGTKKLAAKTGWSLCFWRVLWPIVVMPCTFVLDIVLNLMYMCSDPDSHEVFHYMTLRAMLELVEGTCQVLFQGYILLRVWNPGQYLPDVHYSDINGLLLASSVLFSMKSVYVAYSSVTDYSKKQTGGNRRRFIWHMTNFGDGLAPSNVFTQIGTRRSVTINGAWGSTSLFELNNLAYASRHSQVLEELRIHDAGWWTQVESAVQLDVITATQNFLDASRLKHFELRGAHMPQWITYEVQRMVSDHPHMQHAECEGVDGVIPCTRNDRIRNHPLLSAVLDDNAAAVRKECSTMHDPRTMAEALALAAEQSSLDVLRTLLLSPGALAVVNYQVKDRTAIRSTPLGCASARMEPFVVDLLQLARADVNKPDEIGQTPLLQAADFNNAATVERLLTARADIHCPKDDGATPIFKATESNSAASLLKLLQGRADPNMPKNDGATPLIIGAWSNGTQVVKILLDARADTNKTDRVGATPTYFAAWNNCTECLEELLKARADPDLGTRQIMTPLHVAAASNNHGPLAKLIKARADIEKANRKGETPLFSAAKNDAAESVALLLAARADPARPANDGTSPYMVAEANISTQVLPNLLRVGAGPGKTQPERDVEAGTAADNAEVVHAEVVAVVEDANASPEAIE